MTSRVSVVIPLYESAPFIRETLDSVAAQTLAPHEVIVVDDGSTDGGGDVARAHRLRPKVIRQENRGPARARNTAIRASTGDLVAFLDADDLWLPEKLARQARALEEHADVGMVFCHACRFEDDEWGRRYASRTPTTKLRSLRGFLLANQAQNLTVVIRRSVFDDVGPIDERPELVGTEDYHYWLRVLARHRALYLRETLAAYRVRSGSLVGADWDKNVEIGLRALRAVLDEDPKLSWRTFGIPPRTLVRMHVLFQLATSRGASARARLRIARGLLGE
jgi:glycosyltransferase involved in cell wall biosynthesis